MLADLPMDLMKRNGPGTPANKIPKLVNSIQKQIRWIWIITGICAAMGGFVMSLLGMVEGPVTGPGASTLSIVTLVCGIMLVTIAGIGLISAPVAILFSRSFRRQLQRMESGQYVAYWRYSDEQWKRFIDDEHVESNDHVWVAILGMGFVGLTFGTILIGVIGVVGWLMASIAVAAAGYPVGLLVRQIRRGTLDRWADEPWFAVIGHEGLYYAEKYLPFSTFGSGLASCQLTDKDGRQYLVFTFYNQTQNGRSHTDHRIPVPWGKEKEARKIVGEQEN